MAAVKNHLADLALAAFGAVLLLSCSEGEGAGSSMGAGGSAALASGGTPSVNAGSGGSAGTNVAGSDSSGGPTTGGASGGAPMAGTAGLAPVEVEGPKAPRFVGRFDFSDPQAAKFAWSHSAVEARFMGSEVSLQLSGSEVFFEVTLDGVIQTLKAGTGSYSLGKGLGAGPHSLRVTRRNEALFGVSEFKGLSIPEQDYLPVALPKRRLEIIGDSISAGYGNEGCPFKDKENSELTYGAISARAVAADLHIIAQSGAGMFKSLGDGQKTLPEIYENTLGGNGGPKWDFGLYEPHAVVINLGTNDQNSSGGTDPATFRQSYKDSYTAFLGLLRGHYPDARIYCASQNGAMATEIQSVVAAASDPLVEYLALNGNNSGCDGHPDLAGHEQIAQTLTAALKADLGW